MYSVILAALLSNSSSAPAWGHGGYGSGCYGQSYGWFPVYIVADDHESEAMKKLKNLDLDSSVSKSKLSDQAIPHLKELTTLDELNLSKTGVTEKGIKELRAALPKTKSKHSIPGLE